MADEKHLKILEQGVEVWNQWRKDNPEIIPDLFEADLMGADLSDANLFGADLVEANLREANLASVELYKADLRGADLGGANLSWAHLGNQNLGGAKLSEATLYRANLINANLSEADLSEADLSLADLRDANFRRADLRRANLSRAKLSGTDLRDADLSEADLSGADLSEADLSEADLGGANISWTDLKRAGLRGADLGGANLSWANLSWTDLSGAGLRGADLSGATLVRTDLQEADLTGCRVYGVSAWDINLEGSMQINLVITPDDQPTVTVDNLEVAQFIYLLLNNKKIRDVIDTMTSKVVLILGRFTPERKAILDAIREELRKRDYLPVLFDFDKPRNLDLTETIRTLAHLARFIIADITEPRSIPQELQAIVPGRAVPVQPLLLKGSTGEYGMFESFKKYHWVLSTYEYSDLEGLLTSLGEKVIKPAEAKAKELASR